MICHNLSEILGFTCHPLNADGSVAFIDSSFELSDGGSMPIYIKQLGSNIMFFDDHETVYHYIKKGYRGTNKKLDTKFIRAAIAPYNLDFDENQISVWGTLDNAKSVFSRYLSGLISASNLDQPDQEADGRIQRLTNEVADLLQAWKPGAAIKPHPKYKGLSKTKYQLDFQVDDEAVVIATPNSNSIGAALRKMVDIAGNHHSIKFRVILEDRFASEKKIKAQSTILSTMATVMSLSSLKRECEHSRSAMH